MGGVTVRKEKATRAVAPHTHHVLKKVQSSSRGHTGGKESVLDVTRVPLDDKVTGGATSDQTLIHLGQHWSRSPQPSDEAPPWSSSSDFGKWFLALRQCQHQAAATEPAVEPLCLV